MWPKHFMSDIPKVPLNRLVRMFSGEKMSHEIRLRYHMKTDKPTEIRIYLFWVRGLLAYL